MVIQLKMRYFKETKHCVVFQYGSNDDGDKVSLYLKKDSVAQANINPYKGIIVTVKESE